MKLVILDQMKKIIREAIVRLGILRRPSVRYCVENQLLPSLLTRTPSKTVREMLNLPPCEHQTQLNQDIFALIMNQFRPGFFLEIGANDGFTFSNTAYLEKEFGWRGVLVEANPRYMASLSKRKNSVIVNRAVSAKEGEAMFIDAGLYGGLEASLDKSHNEHTDGAPSIKVKCIRLQELLDTTAAPMRVDFVSVDVEGGEIPIAEQMVKSNRRFGCGCIEVNKRKSDYARIAHLLGTAGYRVVWENQTEHDLFFVDCQSHPIGCETLGGAGRGVP
jgi:FkbM family methyltransferase